MSLFTDTLAGRLAGTGIELSPAQTAQCEQYYRRVCEANRRFNLTRITEPAQAAKQHFADAMRLCAVLDIPAGASVIDVGAGAGFPGVPLLILRPDIRLTLLDAAAKKTAFLRGALNETGLCADVVCGRAEDLTELRGSFDLAVSRAVAPLPMLLELSVPLLRTGGVLAAWKGEAWAQELDNAAGALRVLGCAASSRHAVGRGALLLIEKEKPTPAGYPRRFSKIKSAPL